MKVFLYFSFLFSFKSKVLKKPSPTVLEIKTFVSRDKTAVLRSKTADDFPPEMEIAMRNLSLRFQTLKPSAESSDFF